jgi:hypothetical protein
MEKDSGAYRLDHCGEFDTLGIEVFGVDLHISKSWPGKSTTKDGGNTGWWDVRLLSGDI